MKTLRYALFFAFAVAVLAVGAHRNGTKAPGPVAGVAEAGAASYEYYLKIDGLEGESVDAAHLKEIVVDSFSWGEMRPTDPATGLATGKVKMDPFSFTMKPGKISPKLLAAVGSGARYKKAVLTVRKPGKEKFEVARWTLTDVVVSSYGSKGAADGIMDAFSLVFTKIETEYRPQLADGKPGTPVKAGWDVKANKPL